MKRDPSIAILNFILLLSIAVYSCSPGGKEDEETTKPNIAWIILEDWGYQLSCYGEPGIQTPNIDKVAAQGIRYTRSFATSPVCSSSSSAVMTGFHQSYIGAHQHRTKNGEPGFSKKPLPDGIKPFTQLLGQEGYFTCFMKPSRKTDLDFTYEGELYQGKDWSEREEGQPFFAQVTYLQGLEPWATGFKNEVSVSWEMIIMGQSVG